MSVIQLTLPSFNGEVGAGLAAAAEKEIENALRLRVLWPVPPQTSASSTTPGEKTGSSTTGATSRRVAQVDLDGAINHTQAYFLLAEQDKAKSRDEKLLMLSSIYIILKGRLLGIDGEMEPSGFVTLPIDAMAVDRSALSEELIKLMAESREAENLSDAATILFAAKINFYKENHHTGQGTFATITSNYMKKCAEKVYGAAKAAQLWSTIHRVSHWASTIAILRLCDVKGLINFRPLYPFIDDNALKVKAAQDVMLRVKSNPAGTARTSIAYAVWQQMIASPVAIFCPGLSDAPELAALYLSIDGAHSHMGAKFLTGKDRVFDDTLANAFLGRAFIYMKEFVPRSTIMGSPHMKNGESYPDYSMEFKQLCTSFKKNMVAAAAKIELGADITGLKEVLSRAAAAFGKNASTMALTAIAKAEKKAAEDRKAEDDQLGAGASTDE